MRDNLLMEVFPVGTKVIINMSGVPGEIITISMKRTEVLYEIMYLANNDFMTNYFQEFQFTAIGDKTCIWEKKHESN